MRLRDLLKGTDPLDLPMTAGTFTPSGVDEAGNKTFKDIMGRTFAIQPRPAKTPQEKMDEFWAKSENLRAPKRQSAPSIKTIVDMLTKDVISGVTAPGRAAAGENVTLGDVLNTAGTATLGAAPMRAPEGALRANSFRAYHGSPHSFDKFDMGKIGTGEGAQAYGHGLYFADNEGVARSYRQALAPGEDPIQSVTFRGREMPIKNPETALEQVVQYMRQLGYKPEDAFKRAKKTFTPEMIKELDGISPADFATAVPEKYTGKGSMYEVQINADPADFLDWDKPLSAQPQKVRDALAPLGFNLAPQKMYDVLPDSEYRDLLEQKYGVRSILDVPQEKWSEAQDLALRPTQSVNDLSGQRLIEQLSGGDANYSEDATAALREAGIPGIKYLDAGSRGVGNGSRNYVVFDDKLIDILRKYGIAGLGIGGAGMMQPQTDNPRVLRDYLNGI